MLSGLGSFPAKVFWCGCRFFPTLERCFRFGAGTAEEFITPEQWRELETRTQLVNRSNQFVETSVPPWLGEQRERCTVVC